MHYRNTGLSATALIAAGTWITLGLLTFLPSSVESVYDSVGGRTLLFGAIINMGLPWENFRHIQRIQKSMSSFYFTRQINQKGNSLVHGQTPFTLALSMNRAKTVQLFLDHNANIHHPDGKGQSPFQMVFEGAHGQQFREMFLRRLFQRIADPSAKSLLQFFANCPRPELFLSAQNPENGWKPLQAAVLQNNTAIVKYLLARNVDALNQSGSWNGNPPLHLALIHGFNDIANMLVDHGADLKERNSHGLTPLILAIHYRRADVLRNMLQ